MTSKPDLVQIVLSLNAGGTERLVVDMSKLLASRANVHVLCLDEAGEWASQLSEVGITVSTLGRKPGFDVSLVKKVRAYLRKLDKPVVHCHHYTPFVYGALASLLSGPSRLIYTEHGRYDDGKPSKKRWLANQVLARLPGHFFAVSHDLRAHLAGEGFSRMQVNHNGIDVRAVPSAAERIRVRETLGIVPDEFVVGTVARLHPVKNLGTLIRALGECDSQSRLVVVGDGEERVRLESEARDLGVFQRVLFLGHRDDAREILPAFDVYVNCSIIEGISVTILEAMAAGVPVVATNVGGTPEIIASDNVGVLVPSRDPVALARALDSLETQSGVRRSMATDARARAETEFSTTAMVNRYLEAYGWEAASDAPTTPTTA